MERKVTFEQIMIGREGERRESSGRIEVCGVTGDPVVAEGVDLVLRTVVSCGMGVARAARLHGIAAYLHVPEQGFAEASRFQACRLLPIIEVYAIDASTIGSPRIARVKEAVIVIFVRKLKVRAGRIRARHSNGCRRVPDVIGGKASSANRSGSQGGLL